MATTGLSAADQAAVIAAAQQGGLSASQGQQIVGAANNNQTVNVSQPGATPQQIQAGTTPADEETGAVQAAQEQTTQTTQQGKPTDQTTQPTTQPTTGQLTMPTSGSVVDLLNMAGADSSFAARTQLAQQYGIQGYTGTAAQNTELAQKYLDSYNKLKGSAVPQTASDARSALQEFQNADNIATQGDPTQQFFDAIGSMDPVQKSIYDSINQINSYINTRTSLQDEISQLPEFQERSDVKSELLNVKRIMEGTENDIRDEITNAGGFATESQVQALSGARNKVLLKQANSLTDQFNVLNDYVNQITDLTKADRAQVMEDMTTKLGLATTLYNMQQSMQSAARDNMKTLVGQIGYTGLAEMLQNDPGQMAQAEKTLGLPNGALSNPAFLQAAAPQPKLTTQIVEVSGRKALVTYDGTGNPVNMVDLGSAATAGSGGLTPGQVNAFNSIVSKYNSSPLIQAADRTPVLSATIANIRKDPANAAQQLNLAYSYVQALDTYQSAVREGELGLVNSIDSKVGQLNNSIQQIQNGQIVRPEVALQIANAAQTIVDTINSAAKQKAQSFSSQANVVGLGDYWNQYVGGFNQGYNNVTSSGKGSLTSSQYVEQTLNQRNVSYQKVLADAPLGQIGVINNQTGELGYIPAEEFNSSLYTRI